MTSQALGTPRLNVKCHRKKMTSDFQTDKKNFKKSPTLGWQVEMPPESTQPCPKAGFGSR
jgi:hypothetical protein